MDISLSRGLYGLIIISIILLCFFFNLEKFFFIFLILISIYECYVSKIIVLNKIYLLLILLVLILFHYLDNFLNIYIFIVLISISFSIYFRKFFNELFAVFLILFFFLIKSLYLIDETIIYLVIFISFFNDTIAYLFGKSLKGPKIISNISPNKTWTGTVISFIFSYILMIYLKIPPFVSLFLSLSLFIGDIYFSFIKRQNDLKDFSNIIPSHGGLLDRLDSMTIFTMIYFIYMQ